MRQIPVAARRCGRLRLERLEDRVTPSFGPRGPEFRVNVVDTGILQESTRSVALDGDGDFVVAWARVGQQPSLADVFIRRYSSSGVALTGEILVNEFTTDDQNDPCLAADADGDCVVAWQSLNQDGSDLGVYARRFDATGAPRGGEFRVNVGTEFNQHNPSVAMAANGDFIIAWESNQTTGSGRGIYARRYDANGVARGGEFRVNATNSPRFHASVAATATGDFMIAWTDTLGVFARRYSAAGVPLSGEIPVPSVTGQHNYPSIAADADGDFVVAWIGDMGDPGYGIYARRFSSAGNPLGGQFQVNTVITSNNLYPVAAMDADGDFVICWELGGAALDVFARRYVGGAVQGQPFRINTTTDGYQRNVSVGIDPDGDFVAAWSGPALVVGNDVFGQSYEDADDNNDTAGPMVGNVFRNGQSDPIFENGRVAAPVAGLTVSLSKDMWVTGGASGVNSITNPANWGLMRNGIDISSQITAVDFGFVVATRRFEANVTLATTLMAGEYVLTARGSLRDVTGNYLDGDFNGIGAGTDFSRHFGIGPPTVASTSVNGGGVQRSRVTSLLVTFNSPVAFSGAVANAFTLTRTGGGAVNFTATANLVGGVTIVTLTGFTGSETQFGSLQDGRYTLAALAGQISSSGFALDGNGDGKPGDNYTFGDAQGLYRFFGDFNGDRNVDIADFGLFSSTYGLNATQSGFISAFDFNGDGVIDIADFGQFSIRIFTVLP
jgi:hypothetical protein